MKLADWKLSAVLVLSLLLGAVGSATARAADKLGLKAGKVELKSAGPLAFGPQGILFVGDTKAATVWALDTGDTQGDASQVKLTIDGLTGKIATLLKVSADQVQVNEMLVNPASGQVYLSIAAGADKSQAALVRIDAQGNLSTLSLDSIPHAQVVLPNPPEDKVVGEGPRAMNRRLESITDLAFFEGRVIVSGSSADKASSTVRSISFPFQQADAGANVEIFHAAHGRVEDNATIRAFVPFMIDGEPNLLAGFTCTPLVKFPLNGLTSGKKVRGTTVAELGNRNRPLDMIVYKKGGRDYLLMANSARGVMKISTEEIERKDGLTEPVKDGNTAGQKFETIKELVGVVHLDKLNSTHAVLLVQSAAGSPLDLKTVELP
ncbi:MAG: hypothetical protein ACKOU6_19210 [Planctomycetota bacterium]